MFPQPQQIMLAARSWLRAHRWSRCLLLLFCSPLLVPLLCAAFPIFCVAELCTRICRRKKEAERLRRCEEGLCDCNQVAGTAAEEKKEAGLLQRYLEDQLQLVGSMYECGDEFDDDHHQDTLDLEHTTPFLG